jgi:DNA-binding NarL/FixJ family response regulator
MRVHETEPAQRTTDESSGRIWSESSQTGSMNDVPAALTTAPSTRLEGLRFARAIVVEGPEVLRSGLVQTLRRLGTVVVADVATAADAAATAGTLEAELVVVGAHVPGTSELVRALKAVAPHCPVVHLATTTDRDEYVALLKAGVDAIAPLTATAADLALVLARVLAGERVFGGTALAAVRPTLAAAGGDNGSVQLTGREEQVLGLLATRRTLAEIADELYVSHATVKTHAARLYAKLSVGSRQEAVERAVALGVLA